MKGCLGGCLGIILLLFVVLLGIAGILYLLGESPEQYKEKAVDIAAINAWELEKQGQLELKTKETLVPKKGIRVKGEGQIFKVERLRLLFIEPPFGPYDEIRLAPRKEDVKWFYEEGDYVRFWGELRLFFKKDGRRIPCIDVEYIERVK